MNAIFIAAHVVAYLSLPYAAVDLGPVIKLGNILTISDSSVIPHTALSFSNVTTKASGEVSPVYLLKLPKFAAIFFLP